VLTDLLRRSTTETRHCSCTLLYLYYVTVIMLVSHTWST